MHYGMTKLEEDFYADNLYKVVQLAPCFYAAVPDWTKFEANRTIMQFLDYGIYALNGPNWDSQLQLICDNFNFAVCEYCKSLTGSQGQSVKSEQYWTINGLLNRFQEFAD